MRFTARPIQQLAIDRMVDWPIQLIALRMGFGKTAAALTAIERLLTGRVVKKALIVAPLRVAELVWAQEAAKWDHLAHLRVVKVLGDPKTRNAALESDADVYVINRENLVWLESVYQWHWPFDLVVIDENRGFRDRASKSWLALKNARRRIKRLYILSGTPTPNSLLELWPQIAILDLGQRLGTGITKFKDKYFLPDKRNGMVIYTWKPKPGAKEEIEALVADLVLTAVGDDGLQERIDNVIPVSIPMDRYAELERDLVTGDVMAVNAAVLAGKLAQMANGAVYDATGGVTWVHDAKLDALEEIVEEGEPVLVFTAYKHDQARIKRRFPQAQEFDGEASLERWKKGEIRLLMMHPASGGHGVDGLQFGGRTAVWFGLPFSLDLYEQANARLHRSGQTQGVIIHHLVAVGTIDERVMQVLKDKGDMQAALLDAVRSIREAA
jgi:SNF2 family DNA or RNA helicase